MRHRRTAERRQVHALQRADGDGGGAGGQLSLLHHRAERRPRRRSRRAAGGAGRLAKSPKIIPTQLGFVDIAGLVRGASKGEGLGNQFLANIREVDAIIHVLRCFEGEVTHVEGTVDPIRDADTVETELMLADLESLERRVDAATKKARGNDKEAKALLALMEPFLAALQAGKPARGVPISHEQRPLFKQLQLLTSHPVLYACNVDESAAGSGNKWSALVAEKAKAEGAATVV